MRVLIAIILSSFVLIACSASKEELQSRRIAFEYCMTQAEDVQESKFALFNKADDLVAQCELYAKRNQDLYK